MISSSQPVDMSRKQLNLDEHWLLVLVTHIYQDLEASASLAFKYSSFSEILFMARKNLVYINNDILKLVIILSVCKNSDFII